MDPITDSAAAASIASQWHGGQSSYLYALASTGKVQHSMHRGGLLTEIAGCMESATGDAAEELRALHAYVEQAPLQQHSVKTWLNVNAADGVRLYVSGMDLYVYGEADGGVAIAVSPAHHPAEGRVIARIRSGGTEGDDLTATPEPVDLSAVPLIGDGRLGRYDEARVQSNPAGATVFVKELGGGFVLDAIGPDRREFLSIDGDTAEWALTKELGPAPRRT